VLASGGSDGSVRAWTVATGVSQVLGNQDGEIVQVRFSAEQALLATLAREPGGAGSIRLWGRDSGDTRTQKLTHAATRFELSPGGRLLAAAGSDGAVLVWDLVSTRTVALRGHEDAVRDLDFAPDRALLATAGQDKTVRLWDLTTGRGRVLGSHAGPVVRVVFAADGRRLVSASEDGTLMLWDVSSGYSRVLRGFSGAVTAVVFSADGQRVLSGGADGTLRVFSDALPVAPKALGNWLDSATRVVIDADNLPSTKTPTQ
jgi:WD40 repeat protein